MGAGRLEAPRASGTPSTPRARGTTNSTPRVRAWVRAAVLACLAASAGCRACPPEWAEAPPRVAGFLYASGSAGEVFADADALSLAASRAARVLADALGLDVEARLSVVHADGRLFVEGADAAGVHHGLDALTLVESTRCDDGRTWVLVRLAVP